MRDHEDLLGADSEMLDHSTGRASGSKMLGRQDTEVHLFVRGKLATSAGKILGQ